MKRPLSIKSQSIVPSATLALSALTKELQANGEDIISFGIGEPDFNVDQVIKQAAIDAISSDFSHYTEVKGIYELREAIAERLLSENGLKYSPDDIIATSGAKHALFTALQTLVSEGDEVIVPLPYWVSYSEMIKLAGGVPVLAKTDFANSFLPDADIIRELINDKTKAVIINDPVNPTGAVMDKKRLKGIVEVCVENGVYIISDEIYDKFLYDGAKHYSAAAFGKEASDITITVNGFSKTYAMPGWRLGYAASSNKDIVKAMSGISGHCISHPSSIVQKAGAAALRAEQGFVSKMVKEYDRRRQYMMTQLNKAENLRFVLPKGAFYMFVDISAYSGDSSDFAMDMLKNGKVAVVPGSAFGLEGFIRLSYACSFDDIVKGMNRFTSYLSNMHEQTNPDY
ncbi:MAG: pyridoxal phosphate-dependent aminotransferase [Eubacteriaceae bacterium]|nr:pyridoxal phosphate-dependent aminotransferase [Eubacteriaceae bacterium]